MPWLDSIDHAVLPSTHYAEDLQRVTAASVHSEEESFARRTDDGRTLRYYLESGIQNLNDDSYLEKLEMGQVCNKCFKSQMAFKTYVAHLPPNRVFTGFRIPSSSDSRFQITIRIPASALFSLLSYDNNNSTNTLRSLLLLPLCRHQVTASFYLLLLLFLHGTGTNGRRRRHPPWWRIFLRRKGETRLERSGTFRIHSYEGPTYRRAVKYFKPVSTQTQ